MSTPSCCPSRGSVLTGQDFLAFYDAETTSRFQAQYGRPLHTFLTPNDDPSVNAYVDANFLRQTVKDHVDAIRTYVLASHPNAKFELLWPLDVNDPLPRRLHRYINLPVEWETKPGSGFDTFIIEGFQFAGIDRNLDKVRWMAGYPFEVFSWHRADCRYLMGLFNAGWPWERENAITCWLVVLSRPSSRSGPTTTCASLATVFLSRPKIGPMQSDNTCRAPPATPCHCPNRSRLLCIGMRNVSTILRHLPVTFSPL